jgi:hypothetical protein
MAVLHGSWVSQSSTARSVSMFFLWGEMWRRLEEEVNLPIHPYAMHQDELVDWLKSLPKLKLSILEKDSQPAKRGRKKGVELEIWGERAIALPTEESNLRFPND